MLATGSQILVTRDVRLHGLAVAVSRDEGPK